MLRIVSIGRTNYAMEAGLGAKMYEQSDFQIRSA
jgi:hypothetical protein